MKTVLLSLYNFHSYAIRGLHSFLNDRGYDVESVYFKSSTYVDDYPKDGEIRDLIRIIKGRKPDIIGISVHSPLFQIFRKVSKALRASIPDVKIVAGGEHPTACPEDFLPYADYIVVGEGERAMVDIAFGAANEGILSYNQIEDLDTLGFPYYGDRTYFYGKMIKESHYSYITGRGCPYRCSYCTETVKNCDLRRKSVDKVIEELSSVKDKVIVFSDSIFTLNKKWLSEFCNRVSGIKFSCYGHTTGIDRDMILSLKNAGMLSYRIGVQSGSEILRTETYNRKDSLEDILKVAWTIHACGIHGIYDFIVNSPYDTPQSLKETRDFIKKLPKGSSINCFELRWFPKTPLTERTLSEGYILPEDVEGNYTRLGGWSYAYSR